MDKYMQAWGNFKKGTTPDDIPFNVTESKAGRLATGTGTRITLFSSSIRDVLQVCMCTSHVFTCMHSRIYACMYVKYRAWRPTTRLFCSYL